MRVCQVFLGYNLFIMNRFVRSWVIIGAAIGFSVAAILLVAYKQHNATEEYSRHRAEHCATLSTASEDKKGCQEEGKSARDYLPWGYILVSWPEGITTWAIILTGVAIAWQSHETRRSAKATEISTIQAGRAYAVARNREKPRVSVTVDDTDLGHPTPFVNITVKYSCPTDAWIKAVHRTAVVRKKGDFPKGELIERLWKSLQTTKEDKRTITHFHSELYSVFISGKSGAYRMSKTTLDEFAAGEVVIVLAVRVLFDDVYGWRDFMFTSVCEASPLYDLNGQQNRNWIDGPEDLNWDKQQTDYGPNPN